VRFIFLFLQRYLAHDDSAILGHLGLNYQFTLKHIEGSDTATILDGGRMGNETRYINHSKEKANAYARGKRLLSGLFLFLNYL
jgi:hypothetical protein